MLINGILSAGYAPQLAARSLRSLQEEEQPLLPSSWGKDTVSFSQEALDAQRAEAGSKQRGKDTMEKDGASASFAEYMRKARGEDPSTGANPQEQLERLKERLKKLTGQKAQIATDEGLAEAGAQSKMEALDAEINQVISQIAELTAQIAATKGKGQS